MQIDPGSRMVRLLDEVSIARGSPASEHFVVAHGNIDRVVPTRPNNTASHPEYFHVNRNSVLLDRSKRQEILSGAFGAIVAQTDYLYESEYGPGYGAPSIRMGVGTEKSSIQRERPNVIGALPSSATPLQMISVIRFSTMEGIDLVAVATYGAEGELFAVRVDALKQGQYPPQPAKPITVDEDIQNSIRQFGFPLRFSITEFRRIPTALYERNDGPSPLTVISFRYAWSRWVHQYNFRDPFGAPAKYDTRTLEFRFTAPDEVLQFLDQTLPWKSWGDQRMFFPKK
jgi:hypothetical protein